MKKMGYLATGLIIGMALTVVTPVLADTVKTISARINSTVKVAIDGKNTKLSAQPIVYNNLNYLPVGEIGRALRLNVSYDKASDTIKLEEKLVQIPTTTPTVTPAPVKSVPKVKVGESITKDGVSTSVDKIEYVTQEEHVDGIVLEKGFKVYITVTNNSDYPLRPGMSYQFSTDNNVQEQVINSLGATFLLKVNNEKFTGEPITKGETVSGFIFYNYSKDVNIKEIHYYLDLIGVTQTTMLPMGTWTIE